MIPWIQVYSNLVTHPKTSKLSDLLKLTSKDVSPNIIATGLLISLWTWAVQNAYDGNLSSCSDRTIAEAARYKKKPESFVSALLAAGWLDPDRKLHDWDEYANLLMEQEDSRKAKTRERVKRYREKKKTSPSTPCNAGVTVTLATCNASTLPNQTIPNQLNQYSGNKNQPVQEVTQKSAPASDGKAFTRFWEAYPDKRYRDDAWEMWKKLNPSPDLIIKIMSALDAWKLSRQWLDDDGGYIPLAVNWLKGGYYDYPPIPKDPKNKPRQLDADEQAAIMRMLEGGITDERP